MPVREGVREKAKLTVFNLWELDFFISFAF